MLISVKKALDEKAAQYTTYAYAMTAGFVREVRLLVDRNDNEAVKYCNEVLAHPGIRAEINRIESAQELEKLLDDLNDRAEEADNPMFSRQFFIYVTSNIDNIHHVNFSRYWTDFRELKYYLLFLSKRRVSTAPPGNFMHYLNVSPGDVHSGRMLVLDASVSSKIISFNDMGLNDEGIWLRLRTKEFSSVKEEILEQLYSELQPQLMPEAHTVIAQKLDAIRGRFETGITELQRNRRTYPTARELPLIGYNTLCSSLQKRVFVRSTGFGFGNEGETVRRTGISVAQALDILFGSEETQSRPEYLRKLLEREMIPEICRKSAADSRVVMDGLLMNGFTLYDICNPAGIAAWSSGYKSKLQVQTDQLDVEIRNYINNTEFCLTSLSPGEIFRGLEDYLLRWDKYINLCFWKEWWGCISEYISEVARKYGQEYQTLLQICDWAKWSVDYQNILLNPGNPLRSVKAVLNKIRGASALRTYSTQDLNQLMERESRLVISVKGDQGDSRLRPVMCMLSGSRNADSGSRRVEDLQWTVFPVSYVPDSVAYIMRITRVLREEG